jgi:hypothetical protein
MQEAPFLNRFEKHIFTQVSISNEFKETQELV